MNKTLCLNCNMPLAKFENEFCDSKCKKKYAKRIKVEHLSSIGKGISVRINSRTTIMVKNESMIQATKDKWEKILGKDGVTTEKVTPVKGYNDKHQKLLRKFKSED